MGSSLGPTLAHFFLGYIEEKNFANIKKLLPKLYLRYIDDVYAVFDCDYDCLKFLEVLNSQHKDIRFTIEKATKFSTLNFLDVQIKLLDNGYETCVWRKPTNTGVLLNFSAICPTWKTGLITCLLHRAKFVCSNCELYTREVNKTMQDISE